eukprot:GDKK01072975.1.p1 GENE.GDKK01072975.1~~GDKK01072975.1.p1  ORF type:complete len:100 (-),score=7.29 GDKK01072975.1:749-1048(-)
MQVALQTQALDRCSKELLRCYQEPVGSALDVAASELVGIFCTSEDTHRIVGRKGRTRRRPLDVESRVGSQQVEAQVEGHVDVDRRRRVQLVKVELAGCT